MNADQRRQKFIRYFKEKTGETDIDMREVAKLSLKNGFKLPKPVDPLDLLAAKFARSARVEIRHDPVTNLPYRANLAMPHGFKPDGRQRYLWVDIDDVSTSRWKMSKALGLYRDQMVGEAIQGMNTTDHWNRINPTQEPLVFDPDLTDDVEWKKNSEDKKAS